MYYTICYQIIKQHWSTNRILRKSIWTECIVVNPKTFLLQNHAKFFYSKHRLCLQKELTGLYAKQLQIKPMKKSFSCGKSVTKPLYLELYILWAYIG